MKLLYRGVSYDYDPQAVNGEKISWSFDRSSWVKPTYNLNYRGSTYTVNPNIQPNQPLLAPIANLIYRGVAYALNGGAQSTGAAAEPTIVELGKAKRSLKGSKRSELAAVHQNNIYRNLQRRIEVAKEQGNQQLVTLLEREREHIA